MREPAFPQSRELPRPGPVVRAVLIAWIVAGVGGAVVSNWLPGGALGVRLWAFFTFAPAALVAQPWTAFTLVSSGLLSSPHALQHGLFSVLGLCLMAPSLEQRWGGRRLLLLLALSVVAGNLLVFVGDRLASTPEMFHVPFVFGPSAAVTAVAIAWSRENSGAQARLYFVLPVSGRTLFWVIVAICVLFLVFDQHPPEGALAPFGGVLVGYALAGSPSPARALWLRLRLAVLRRQGRKLASVPPEASRARVPPPKRGGKNAPVLRLVPGGLEDELKKRKPPKDKRYLN